MFKSTVVGLTWKKSAMVATWLAQAHFLASGTSSPTWERVSERKKEKWRGEREIKNPNAADMFSLLVSVNSSDQIHKDSFPPPLWSH